MTTIQTPIIKASVLAAKLTKLAEEAVAQRVFSGCSIGITQPYRPECPELILPFGTSKYKHEDDTYPIIPESVYDLASITKCIVHALVHRLADLGLIDIQEPVVPTIPLRGMFTDELRVHHLMSFTAIFKMDKRLEFLKSDQVKELLFSAPLVSLPGERHEYKNAITYLLVLFLEQKTGKDLETLLHQYLLGPLGMNKTTFRPRSEEWVTEDLLVPSEEVNLLGPLWPGTVHDEFTHAIRPDQSGAAGLFGTVGDLMIFSNAFICSYHPETDPGERFFSKKSMEHMMENKLESIGHRFSYGWDKLTPNYISCKCFNHHAMVMTGFVGTSLMIDAVSGRGIVILTNRIWPKRGSNDGIRAFRQAVAEEVVGHCKECG